VARNCRISFAVLAAVRWRWRVYLGPLSKLIFETIRSSPGVNLHRCARPTIRGDAGLRRRAPGPRRGVGFLSTHVLGAAPVSEMVILGSRRVVPAARRIFLAVGPFLGWYTNAFLRETERAWSASARSNEHTIEMNHAPRAFRARERVRGGGGSGRFPRTFRVEAVDAANTRHDQVTSGSGTGAPAGRGHAFAPESRRVGPVLRLPGPSKHRGQLSEFGGARGQMMLAASPPR